MPDGQETQGDPEWIAPVISFTARRVAASGDLPGEENDVSDQEPGTVTVVAASGPAMSSPAVSRPAATWSGPDATPGVSFLPGVREAEERRAENVSLHALTRRGMSSAEVLDLLQRREVDPIVAEMEIARLEGSGLLDDDALARTLVERLTERKKLGPSAIRAELQRRRLSSSTIEVALAERQVDDEGALLDGIVDDRVRRMGSLDRETAERRLLAFLARKGHVGGEARDSVRRALDEAGLMSAPRNGFGQRGLGQRGPGQHGSVQRGSVQRGTGGGFGRSGGIGGRPVSGDASRRGDGAAEGPRAVEFE